MLNTKKGLESTLKLPYIHVLGFTNDEEHRRYKKGFDDQEE